MSLRAIQCTLAEGPPIDRKSGAGEAKNIQHLSAHFAAFLHVYHLYIRDILEFLAQLFGGSNHFYQTDIKVLTYLAHYLARNIYHLECHKDPSLALFCSAYILHRSAKLLLIVISVITFMLMTHRFIYHFHNQMYKNLFRLLVIALLISCRGWNQVS